MEISNKIESKLKRLQSLRLFYVEDANGLNSDDCRIMSDVENMSKIDEVLRQSDHTKIQIFGIFGDNKGLRDFWHSLLPNSYVQLESLFTNNDQMPEIWAVFNDAIFAFLLTSNEDITLERQTYFTIIMQRYLQDMCPNILICPSESFFEKFSPNHSFQGKAHGIRSYKLVKTDLVAIQPPQNVQLEGKNLLNSLIDTQCRNVLITNSNQISYCVRKMTQESYSRNSETKSNTLYKLLQDDCDIESFTLRTILKFCEQSKIFLSDKQKGEIDKIIGTYTDTYRKTIQRFQQEIKPIIQELIHISETSNSVKLNVEKNLKNILCSTLEAWIILPESHKATAEEMTEYIIGSLQSYIKSEYGSGEIKPQHRADFISKIEHIDKNNAMHESKENAIKLIMIETQSENQLDIRFDIHRLFYTPQFDNQHRLQLLTVNCSVPIHINFYELNLFMKLSEISEADRLELPRRIELIACFSSNDNKEEIIVLKRPKIINKRLDKQYGYTILLHKNELFRKISDFYLDNLYVAYASNQNSKTLILYHIDTGQVTRCLINEFGQLFHSSNLDLLDPSKKPSGIKSLALTVAQDLLILIDSNSNIYQFDISKESNIRLSILTKKTNHSNCQTNFTADNGEHYDTVQTIGEKNPVFFFQAKSSIDIIDQNYQQICSIKVEQNFQVYKMQIFTDYVDTYCVLFNMHVNEVYCIQNLISDTRIERQLSSNNLEKLTKQYVGNRLLDVIKRGEMYFGSSDLLVIPQYHFILLPKYSTYSDRIEKYFRDLSVSSQLTIGYKTTDLICSTTNIEHLINIMQSRIPLQLCTIDAGTLTPFNSGRRDRVDYLSSKLFRIEMKAREISFSYLDKILNEIKDNIKIIGIIGRQSTGKSYLLNKIFQTRFAVAAGRCTDGIWMSYAFIDNTHFLVLDCEGLFSDQRTEDEEIKLISFLTAVCDITILSQDLGFSRFQDRLFAALSQAVEKINKSEKLFKGILLVAVRDVSDINDQETFDATEKKFLDLQSKGKSAFLEQLFSNTYKVQLLHHFENQNFDREVGNLRKLFIEHTCWSKVNELNLLSRWENGKDLADRLKILLVQLYTNDFLDSDEIHTEMKLTRLTEQMEKAWTRFDFDDEEEITWHEQIINERLENKKYLMKFDHRTLQLEENAYDQNFENICEFILNQLYPQNQSLTSTKEEINQMRIFVDQFIPEVLKYRRQKIQQWIMKRLKEEFPSENRNNEQRIRKFIDASEQYMLSFKLQMCLKKCSICDLKCIRSFQHQQETKLLLESKKKKLEEFQASLTTETSDNTLNHNQELKKNILIAKEKRNDLHKEKSRLFNELNYLFEKEKLETNLNQCNYKIDIEKAKIKDFKDIITEIDNQFKTLGLNDEYLKDKNEFVLKLNEEILQLSNPNQCKNDHINQLIEKFYQMYARDRKPENELLCFEIEEGIEAASDFQCNTIILSRRIDDNINKLTNYRDFIQKCLEEIEQRLKTNREYLTDTNDRILTIEQQLNDAEKQKQDMRELVKAQKIEYENLIRQFTQTNKEKEMLTKQQIDEDNKLTDTKVSFEVQNIQHYIQELQSKLSMNNQSIEQRKNHEARKLQYFFEEKTKKESALAARKKKIELSSDKIRIKELEEKITNDEETMMKLQKSIDNVQQVIKSIEEEENIKHKLNQADQLLKNIQLYDEKILSAENQLLNAIKRKNIKEKSIVEMKNEQLDGVEEEDMQLVALNKTIEIIQIELNDIQQEKSSILSHNSIGIRQSFINQLKNSNQHRLDELLELTKHLNENIKQVGISLNFNETKLNNQEQEIINLKTNLDKQKTEQEERNNYIQIDNELREVAIELLQSLTAAEESLLTTSTRIREIVEIKYLLEKYISSSDELKLSAEEEIRLGTIQEELAQKLHALNNSGLICSYTTIREYEDEYNRVTKDYDEACLYTKTLEQQLSELDIYSHLKEEIARLESDAQKNCSCETDHKCSGKCCICASKDETKQNQCMFLARHYGEHKCNAGHNCTKFCQICEIYGLPQSQCHYLYDHTDPQHHQCERSHQCPNTCICSDSCAIPLELKKHDVHRCNRKDCWKPCMFSCGKLCAVQNHDHDANAEIVMLNINAGVHQMKKHLCDQPHNCKGTCNAPGVCKQIYKQEERTWITNSGQQFTYDHIKVQDFRSKCRIQVPAGESSHDDNGNHHCDEQHTCQERCPDCRSFCRNLHGHDGYHKTIHRNKDMHIFTSTNPTDQIEIHSTRLEENIVRKYSVGDLAQPENCSVSCKRRGRSHFHLVECPGGSDCWEEKLVNKAKHSNETYYYKSNVASSKKYDQILCSAYWSQKNWCPPIDSDNKQLIDSCNTYCANHIERDRNGLIVKDSLKGFCTLDAWHIGNHVFECQNDHYRLEMYQGIDICFVIDTTLSMEKYFDKVKLSITRIIHDNQDLLKRIKSKCDFQFAVVDYRDHLPEGDYVCRKRDFTNHANVITYVKNLKSGSGGDPAEAVLDALEAACELRWRDNVDRLLFHVLDAPPHGTQYHKFAFDRWPDGCPCGKTSQYVLQKMKKKKISYHVLHCSDLLNMMIAEFKTHIDVKKLSFDHLTTFEDVIAKQVERQLIDTEMTLKRV